MRVQRMIQLRSAAALPLLFLLLTGCGPDPPATAAPGDASITPGTPTEEPPTLGLPSIPARTTIAPSEPAASPDDDGTTSMLPCRALAADVGAALGPGLSVDDTVLEQHGCTYNLRAQGPDSVAGLGGIVDISLEEAGSTDLSEIRSFLPGGEDLGGVGDAAYWSRDAQVLYAVEEGSTYAVQLATFGADLDDPRSAAITIMLALFAKI